MHYGVLQKMIVIPRLGAGSVHFGMTSDQTIDALGTPDRDIKSEDGERRFRYDNLGLVLTFESLHDFKLGWIIVANPSLRLWGKKIIGELFSLVELHIDSNIQESKTFDDFESWTSTTWSDSWIEIQETAGWVSQVNIGVPFNSDDEPIWPDESLCRTIRAIQPPTKRFS